MTTKLLRENQIKQPGSSLKQDLIQLNSRIFKGFDEENYRKVIEPAKKVYLFYNSTNELVGNISLRINRVPMGGRNRTVTACQGLIALLPECRQMNRASLYALREGLFYKSLHPGEQVFFLTSLLQPFAYHIMAKYTLEMFPRFRDPLTPAERSFFRELAENAGYPLQETSGGNFITHRNLVPRDILDHDEEAVRNYSEYTKFYCEENPGYREGWSLLIVSPVTASNLFQTSLRFFTKRRRSR